MIYKEGGRVPKSGLEPEASWRDFCGRLFVDTRIASWYRRVAPPHITSISSHLRIAISTEVLTPGFFPPITYL